MVTSSAGGYLIRISLDETLHRTNPDTTQYTSAYGTQRFNTGLEEYEGFNVKEALYVVWTIVYTIGLGYLVTRVRRINKTLENKQA